MPKAFFIKFTHNILQVQNQFIVMERITIPRQFEQDAEKSGKVLIRLIKNHIPGARLVPGQRFPSTNRLLASFGIAEPQLTSNPDFNPDDAIFKILKRNNRIQVVVGTSVPYAAAVNDGFTMEGPKRVFFKNTGQWATVNTFFFPGRHFVEKGEAEADKIIHEYFRAGVDKAIGANALRSKSIGQRFRSLAQPRDIKGQFVFVR